MYIYSGKKCPYCKTEFKEGDEIVICSSCEMPHHKECWIDNKGCTTFGCMGTIQGVDIQNDIGISSAPKYDVRIQNEQHIICVSCGAVITSGDSFCSKCGTPVQGNIMTSSNGAIVNKVSGAVFSGVNDLKVRFKTNEELDMDLPYYIGSKSEYYMPIFGELKRKKKYIHWNWSAFLIAPFWCAYRKMYIPAAILLAIDFICIILGGFIGIAIGISVAICAGLFCDYLYMYDLEQRVARGKGLDELQKNVYMNKHRDVNVVVPSIAAVVFVLLCAIILLRK